MKRTDMEKLTREPVPVVLGGKEYCIHPKPIRQSRKWKDEAHKVFQSLQLDVTNLFQQGEQSLEALRSLLFDHLEKVLDLVFEWEPNLPKDEILDSAYEDELVDALMVILGLAFPLAQLSRLQSAASALNTNKSTQIQS